MSGAWKEAGLPDIEILPEEKETVKKSVMHEPGGMGEATRLLQTPYYRTLARLHPRTRGLYYIWTFLGFFNLLCITVLPIALFFFTRWYWALAPIVLNFLIVQPIHNTINLELFARLTVIQLKMIELAE